MQVRTIDELLEEARSLLVRVDPSQLDAAVAAGALLVDIRPWEQRARDGSMPGAIQVDRNVLEWRLTPSCPHRLPEVDEARTVIVICNEGYSSSLAAAELQSLGLAGATDLIGGFQGWLAWKAQSAEV